MNFMVIISLYYLLCFYQKIILGPVSYICDLLPLPLNVLCKQAVNTYGPMVLSELSSLINPNKICTTLHLCKPSFLHDLLSDKVFLNDLKPSLNASLVGSNQTCQWCKTVVGEVKSFLSGGSTQVFKLCISSVVSLKLK